MRPGQDQPVQSIFQVPAVAWKVQGGGPLFLSTWDLPMQNLPTRMVVLLQRENE